MGLGSRPTRRLFSQDAAAGYGSSSTVHTHLDVVRGRLVAGPLESLRHVAKDLHRRQQVASIEVPPLGEVEKVFGDLGHPVPREHPLALGKVPLNLQKKGEDRTVGQDCDTAKKAQLSEQMKRAGARKRAQLKSASGHNVVILTEIWKSALLNKRLNWSRRHIFMRKVHGGLASHIGAHGRLRMPVHRCSSERANLSVSEFFHSNEASESEFAHLGKYVILKSLWENNQDVFERPWHPNRYF